MNKTVIITGASRGIGLELAKKFKNNGYNVVGTYLNSKLEALKLTKLNIDMICADVSCYEEMQSVYSYAIKKYKRVDLVINNAGIALPQKFILDVTDNEFNSVLNVNLKGVFNSTKLAVNHMLSNGGKIINISSILALKGGSCEAVYSASKAGVLAFSRAVAEELESSSVLVCAVVLGLIDTDMNGHLSNEEKLEFVKSFELKKIASPNMVASKIFKIAKNIGDNGKVYKIFAGKF